MQTPQATAPAMSGNPVLDSFLRDAAARIHQAPTAADCVQALAPQLQALLAQAPAFLKPAHYQADPDHYARNLVHEAPDGSLSLYVLVWSPGQWTPVHDHGSWGVVGVLEGQLEEHNYVRSAADGGADSDDSADSGIRLQRGGVFLLAPGTVTSFVPNPDHIHRTGVPAQRPRAVSLHLYGRMMSSFNTYDVAAGTRQRVSVAHNES